MRVSRQALDRWMERHQIGPFDLSYVNTTLAFLEAVEAVLPKGAVVLDLGCGCHDQHDRRGRFAHLVSTFYGIDIEPGVYRNKGLDLACRGDVCHIPFRDKMFDVVYADYVMEHVERPDKAFSEVYRVLKPGGHFVFRTPNFKHYVPLVAKMAQGRIYRALLRLSGRDEQDSFPTYFRANTHHRLVKLAYDSGFRVVGIQFADGGPFYLKNFLPLYTLGILHQWCVNKISCLNQFCGNIIGTFVRPGIKEEGL
ncbi:class I SAM-dependent methyltransferase [Desulfohalobiaceae bacterium Ax17]|jgi:SAM-dependent methyltransferase|uniref:class I SAM-dependent methyltransferase n=1 Tax=Desulfovulcanus ferrireducens TaxID=2831190 RepID=UPI00207B9EBD|nr:class I SAM-dependent methyltransferase [Desulfovulcanus ferrireducens]MBT8763369.1 class I SAM-dependent methyltransferase [Desulfovulcanus ferrireducens]